VLQVSSHALDWTNTSSVGAAAAAAGGLCAGDGVDSSSSDSELHTYSSNNNNNDNACSIAQHSTSTIDDCGKKRTIDIPVLPHKRITIIAISMLKVTQ